MRWLPAKNSHLNRSLQSMRLECPACEEITRFCDMRDHVDSSHTRPETSRTSAPQLTANTSEHQQTSQNEKMRSTPPIQGPQDSVALEKIEAEVVMLKGYIKNLEERIQRLETPLRKLIQRLRERGRLTLAIQRDNI
ncbi:uncharacterized protein LOC144104324 isoform X5 [Amblyomma americanum]